MLLLVLAARKAREFLLRSLDHGDFSSFSLHLEFCILRNPNGKHCIALLDYDERLRFSLIHPMNHAI